MITSSDRVAYQRFTSQLLRAMGLGALGTASVLAGCGNDVITAQASGAGGSTLTSGGGGNETTGPGPGSGGFTTTSTGIGPGAGGFGPTTVTVGVGGSQTTGGGGGFVCDVMVPPAAQLVYACLHNLSFPCPDASSPEVLAQAQMQLDVTNPGCGSAMTVTSVPCGPDPNGNGCCYDAILQTELCEGRPFSVGGRARTAAAIARGGWRAALAPDLARIDPATRRALAEAWERDARYEHASVASFARFALELLAAGAPADLLAETQRAMGDEIVHAELCFGLAGAYAGEATGPGPLAIDGALAGRHDLAAIAAAAVREGCIGETIAALTAEAMLAAAEDDAVRGALARIAEDEAAHARLSWRFVAWAIAAGPEDVRDAVAAAFAVAPPSLHADAFPAGADRAAMRAHGRLDAPEGVAVASRAWSEVIRPCARALLGVADEQAASRGDGADAPRASA
jgi:hypothetical protein